MKKIISLAFALLLSITPLFTVGVTAQEEIVKDGLVAWYDGKNNTENGHNADTLVWYDLAGDNDVTVIKDEKNYFTDDAYHLNSTKHIFPKKILDTVNANEFTVELRLGSVKRIGSGYATFINSSSNDNFALFLRNSGDYIEFKSATNSRPKVTGGLEYVTDSTLTVTFKVGGKCSMYVDGILIGSTNVGAKVGAAGDMFFGHTEANKAHEADYKGMRFYSRELSADEVVKNATADGTFDPSKAPIPYTSLAQPSTNIVGDITFCEFVTTKEKLDSFKAAEYVPANAIFYVNESLKVTTKDGKNEFAQIAQVIESLGGKIIPVFYIKDTKTADALITYLKDNNIKDVTVMSDKKDVVKHARQEYTFLRGVIDYTEELAGKTLGEKELLEIRAENTSNLAKTALLPASAVTGNNVKYLNSRQITTWIMADENSGEKQQLDIILSQAYGIVAESTKEFYDTAMKYFDKNSLVRIPQIIGHRGIPSTHPENTLEGAIAAYEAGADVIEIDIYLTIDGVIVINHDSKTTLYNKQLAVESCTYQVLSQLEYKGCKIPTLEQFLKEFKGKDVLLFIEIKSNKPMIVTKMKELIDEYDMYGQCAVIAYESTTQLPNMIKKYPELPVGGLSGLTNSGLLTTMPAIMEFVGKYNTTFNPSYSGYDSEYIKESLARGITTWPYTINTAPQILQYIGYGHAGITTNYANVTGNLIKDLTIKTDKTEGIKLGEIIKLDTVSTNFKRENQTLEDVEYVIVEGNDIAKIENGELVFTGVGTASVMAKTSKAVSGFTYKFYSELASFTSTDSTQPDTTTPDTSVADKTPVAPGTTTPEQTKDQSDNADTDYTVIVIIAVAVVAIVAVGAVIVIKKIKK